MNKILCKVFFHLTDVHLTVYLFVFAFFQLFFVLIATPNENLFQEIPKKKMVSKLKGLAFATIRTSIIKSYSFTEPKEIRYVPCQTGFLSLPGDFPCSLLTWDDEAVFVDNKNSAFDSANTETESPDLEQNIEDALGGIVTVHFSKVKSPNIGGEVLRLGEDEDKLILFYEKEGHLSHYTFQNQVVIFRWKSFETAKKLDGVTIFKLDGNSFPLVGWESSRLNP
jgi:hypothetical protein